MLAAETARDVKKREATATAAITKQAAVDRAAASRQKTRDRAMAFAQAMSTGLTSCLKCMHAQDVHGSKGRKYVLDGTEPLLTDAIIQSRLSAE